MLKRIKLFTVLFAAIALVSSGAAFAYQVPWNNSNIKYFYVFGQEGDPLMGAEDNQFELFIDVPAAYTGDVTISIFDPDTGGNIDWRVPDNKWSTECEFAVYGSDLLDKKQFGDDPSLNDQWYTFGPYPAAKGKKVGDFNRFTLVVKGLKGDDQNLFKVKITPESAESFAENMTFRLLPVQGDQMFFYPQVPAGTKSITVENYDLDATGGTSTLAMTPISPKYKINDSKSGQWAKTVVPLSADTEGRLVYTITKATQRYANAGIRMETDSGKAIPIYFRKGSPPVVERPAPAPVKPKPMPKPAAPDLKCNKFTFDATRSYDIDKQPLSFLWNFGDGNTSTEPVVTHIYEKGGEYTVTLSVKDNSGLPCDSAVTSQKVYVNTAPVASLVAPDKVCLGSDVRLDASGTTDDTPQNLSYFWNFGDGERAEGKTVTHTYKKGGKYNVSLLVNDNSGTECATDSVQKVIHVNTAPIADAGKDISMCLKSLDQDYTVVLSGTGSRDPDGDSLNYVWNLDDGTTEQGATVTHVYKKSGTYNATLTVNDGSGLACSSASDSVKIDLNKAPMADAGKDIKACTSATVPFDGSGSKTEPGETLSYDWSFGDGATGTGVSPSHAYSKGGKYTVLLTVDDGKGTTCSKSSSAINVLVNSRPSAVIKEVADTCVGKKVMLDASASKDPDGDSLSYDWNFGDGTKTKGASQISHTYEKGGVYNVSVSVDDGKDSPCSMASDAIKVKVNSPPSAAMNISKACCVDMEQKFDASGSNDPDGDNLNYLWDFGDGTTGSGARVTHTYTEPGVYKVFLKVDDGSGTECSSAYATDHIKVNAKPVPVIEIK